MLSREYKIQTHSIYRLSDITMNNNHHIAKNWPMAIEIMKNKKKTKFNQSEQWKPSFSYTNWIILDYENAHELIAIDKSE